MARPLRIEYPGAWYHVMNRGASRQVVFRNNAQRAYFLALLSDTAERFHAEWHAYCLMDNHYHLMLRTPEGNLQRIMRHINGLYTQHYNRTQRTDGPLFRGRYKSVLVDAQAYWLHLSRYIHRNPLEAGVVRELSQYPWSSYPTYLEQAPKPPWLTVQTVLRAIGSRNLPARYSDFVEGESSNDSLDAFYGRHKQASILGNERFVKRMMAQAQPLIDPEVPESKELLPKVEVEAIIDATACYYSVSNEKIYLPSRGRGVTTPARSVAMYLCQQTAGLPLKDIAARFGLAGYASAGSTIRLVRQRLTQDKVLSRDVNLILQDLTS